MSYQINLSLFTSLILEEMSNTCLSFIEKTFLLCDILKAVIWPIMYLHETNHYNGILLHCMS